MEDDVYVKCFKCSCKVLILVLTAVCFSVNKYCISFYGSFLGTLKTSLPNRNLLTMAVIPMLNYERKSRGAADSDPI